MAIIVVTRLRLKDPALLDDFFTDALAAIEQAQKSDGNLGVDALADANNAWWSVTSWQERRLMQSYVRTDPHRTIQSHLDRLTPWSSCSHLAGWDASGLRGSQRGTARRYSR